MARIWWWKNEEKCCKQDDCIHCKQSHCIWMLTLLYSKKSSAFIDNVLEECIDISPQPWIFFIKMPKPLVWFSPPCSAFSYWIILQSQKLNVGKTTTEYHQWTPSFIDFDTRCLKITKKSHSTLRAKQATFTEWPKVHRNAKISQCWWFFENLKFAVKQCYQIGQKLAEKYKCDILSNFQTPCNMQHGKSPF